MDEGGRAHAASARSNAARATSHGARREPDRSPLERFLGMEPEEILPKLREGDPLHIQEACALYLRREALILDPARVYEGALIEVSVDAALCSIEDIHADWLDNSIQRVVQRLLKSDREDEEFRRPELVADFLYVHEAFHVPPGLARVAANSFNALPFEKRRIFFILLIENRPPKECTALGFGEEATLRAAIWECLIALRFVTEEEYAEFRRSRGYDD